MKDPIILKFKNDLLKAGKYDLEKKIINSALNDEILLWSKTGVVSEHLHEMLYLMVQNMMRSYYINQEINFNEAIVDTYIKLVGSLSKFTIKPSDEITNDDKHPNPFAYFTTIIRNNIYTICNKFTKNRLSKDRIFMCNGEYFLKDVQEMEFENYIRMTRKLKKKIK